jgi:outer membrane protein OmpA-like peptidoglycan-associated protein
LYLIYCNIFAFHKTNLQTMSILNSLKGLVTDQLVSGVAGHLGESNDGITKAMGGIFPSLLGSMMGAKQEDHSMLGGLLSQAGNLGGGNLVGDLLGGLTGGNNNSGISGIGSSLVSGLLGNKMGGAVSLISNLAGIKSSSSSSLMGIGGSLLASFLGKKMLGDNMNFGGIMNMITGQKDEIMKAAPAGFASTLGLGNLFGDAKETVTHAATSAANTVTNTAHAVTGGNDDNSGGGMKWLWPLLLLAGLGLGAWALLKGCNKDETATTPTTEEVVAPIADSAVSTVTTATTNAVATVDSAASKVTTAVANAVESIKVKLSNGIELNANKGGVEDKLVAFLNDPAAKLAGDADKTKDWFDFDNLNFDLGKSTITKGSMVQIDNLAAILKAYPNLKIKVGGYTDKKGDDAGNLKLSQSRADAVFAALKAKGANVAQLTKAEGYGETLATIAESASDEARRADRRTAVRIIAK